MLYFKIKMSFELKSLNLTNKVRYLPIIYVIKIRVKSPNLNSVFSPNLVVNVVIIMSRIVFS